MKTLLILFCVVGLIHTVHGVCYSCKPSDSDRLHSSCESCKPGSSPCDDPYFPTGPEINACDPVHEDLCKKYGGSYYLGCSSGSFYDSISFDCTVTCGAGPITPSLLLMSIVLAFAIKMVH